MVRERPRGAGAAAPPQLGDRFDIEVVLVGPGIVEWGRLGIGLAFLGAGIRGFEDAEPFGDGSHHAVLDPVVDHLDEVARTRRTTVKPAVLAGMHASTQSQRMAA